MGENSAIQWTDHTFNPWWGCSKVHTGCLNCYAEKEDHRRGGVEGHWGAGSLRLMLSVEHWRKPLAWNRRAAETGVMEWVFCASLCDVFEDVQPIVRRDGYPVARTTTGHMREDLFTLIGETPYLSWQLLTKRPQNISGMVPVGWLENWPANVMTGTSVSDPLTAQQMIPPLLEAPGRHFVSFEPALLEVEFRPWLPNEYWCVLCGYVCDLGAEEYCCECGEKYPAPSEAGEDLPCPCGSTDYHDACPNCHQLDSLLPWSDPGFGEDLRPSKLDWLIVGGESGAKDKARSMSLDIVRSVIEQGRDADVPVFVKQMGSATARALGLKHGKGGDPNEWDEDLRVQQMPEVKV